MAKESKMFNYVRDKTKSVCPVCHVTIDAQIVEKNSCIYLVKACPQHGQFNVLLEEDSLFYRKFMNTGPLGHENSFSNISICLTYLCNLNCSICRLPKRKGYGLSLGDIKEILSGFDGNYVQLTGGEPTLRKDLPQIIEYIAQSGKTPIVVTNGLKLASLRYVQELKRAGLMWVHFSFNGFDDKVYEKINGKKLLQCKLQALKNLKRSRVNTILSMPLVKGINEKELKKVYRYSLNNLSFIKGLRIRITTSKSGLEKTDCFYLSEMAGVVSKIIGVSRERFINHCFARKSLPCHLMIDLFPLLMDELTPNVSRKPIIRQMQTIFWLWSRLGLRNLVRIVIRKLKKDKRLLDFTIQVRARPDKHNIDLTEIKRCPSAYVTGKNKRLLPLCLSLMYIESER